MIIGMNDQFLIALSVSVYRLLLFAYPEEFRQEYGGDMLQVFRDCCLRDYRENGSLGVFGLWAVTLLDLVKSIFEEHLQKETKIMNKNTLIRLSGWALVLAGVGIFTIFFGWYLSENYPLMHIDKTFFFEFAYVYGLVVSPFLLAIGMFGLIARYRSKIGAAANSVLLFGAVVGPVLTMVGILGTPGNDNLWMFHIYGPSVSMLCLTIFGFMALGSKPLPRWNGLPILAGIFLPVFLLIDMIQGPTNGFPSYTLALLVIQLLSMVILGVTLQGDVEHQPEALMAAAD